MCVAEQSHRVIINNGRAKYPVVDVHDGLIGNENVKVELFLGITPWVGAIRHGYILLSDGVRMPRSVNP